MSRIIFEDEYVIVFPTFRETSAHAHPFYHIFFLEDDEILVTGSGMKHTMPECRLFLMIDPTSDIAEHLNDLLTGEAPERISLSSPLVLDGEDDASVSISVERCLTENGFRGPRPEEDTVEDYRVVRLIREINEYRYLDEKIDKIASGYGISESRLSHAFKETVGISLKGYLMIAQLKHAYLLVMAGESKTRAALDSGFASPAHLAYVCKKQMGISITEVLK